MKIRDSHSLFLSQLSQDESAAVVNRYLQRLLLMLMINVRRRVYGNLGVEYIEGGSKLVRDNWAVLDPADDSNPNIHNSSNMLFMQCIHRMARDNASHPLACNTRVRCVEMYLIIKSGSQAYLLFHHTCIVVAIDVSLMA